MTSVLLQIFRENHMPIEHCGLIRSLFGDEAPLAISGSTEVVIYGAGSGGKDMFDCLSLHCITPVAFCDGNKTLHNQEIKGVHVISVEELLQKHPDCFVVVGTNNHKGEIVTLLKSVGIKRICLIEDNEEMYFYLNYSKWHRPFSDIEENINYIAAAYLHLDDDLSRTIFIKRLSVITSYADFDKYSDFIENSSFPKRLAGRKKHFSAIFEGEMYFDNDLIKLGNDEVLLDAGAFDGDTLREFVKQMESKNHTYQHIYCLEPDKNNFINLKNKSRQIKNVSFYQLGAWSTPDTLRFASSELMNATEAGIAGDGEIFIRKEEDDCLIEVDQIDNIVNGKCVTIIKMDIEGAERDAIMGATKTIMEWHPRLIISAYHRSHDCYSLVLLLKKIAPSYHFFLRHFSFGLSETVIIALPASS